MNRSSVTIDRASLLSLKVLAVAHALLFVAFLASLVFAAGRAHAEAAACAGTDLLAGLQKSDPSAYAGIKSQAAATINGKGRLWKLEKPGEPASYLYGTMHSTDDRVTTLPPKAGAAFEAADTVVIETTDVLDQQKMSAALLGEPALTMLPGNTTLTSLLSPADSVLVDSALQARGIPPSSVVKMQPWLLSEPACELARQGAGMPVLDARLAGTAKAEGKSVEGLESAVEQFRAMAALPLDQNVRGLVETLRLGDKINDVTETMIDLYVRGEIGMIWPMLRATAPAAAGDDKDYAAFQETLIDNRNARMAERALPMLAKGKVFMAVGALHLPGRNGLVETFRKAGYTVTAVAD